MRLLLILSTSKNFTRWPAVFLYQWRADRQVVELELLRVL